MRGARVARLVLSSLVAVFLCSCFGGYRYHLKTNANEDGAVVRRGEMQSSDWPVPPACRGAAIVLRVGEQRIVVSEYGSPWKTGFLVPGLVLEDSRVARVSYGGGKNDGNVTLLAVGPGETRAWYVRAIGSGAQRRPDVPDPRSPADLVVTVIP